MSEQPSDATAAKTIDARALPRSNRDRSPRNYLLVFEVESTRMFELPATGDVLIGRGETADLRIDDASISRSHARLSVRAAAVMLADLESQNGTQVNDDRVGSGQLLRSGDVVTIGGITLVFHAEQPAGTFPGLLEPGLFRPRFEEELERALRFVRPLSLVSLALGPRPDKARVGAALVGMLRRSDVGSFLADQLVLLLPETEPEAAERFAERAVRALAAVCPQARAGVAHAPGDGAHVDALGATAREAATAAEVGQVKRAADNFRLLSLGAHRVVVADPVMVRLFALAERLARSALPVLIHGETGTGKELLASALHCYSPRKAGRLVTVNCAALPENLAESELFGHEKGAFTGASSTRVGLLEAASGGTVFLDELGDLSLAIQAKLLRALETKRITRVGGTDERPIDVRLLAATHRDLNEDIEAGRFRRDLFFRVSGTTMVIPPLRERSRELPILARRFLEEASGQAGREAPSLSAAAMAALLAHSWPGNVRELKNAMEFFAASVADDTIEPWHVHERLGPEPVRVPEGEAHPATGFRPIADEVRELETSRMLRSLKANGWNQTRAAQAISMPLRTFVTKFRQYELGQNQHD